MSRLALAATATALALAAGLAGPTPARATEIFAAEGAWVGEGSLATGPEAPLERGRCRVEIRPLDAGTDVSVTGTCAVAAGMTDISMRIVRSGGGRINAGVWTAATGQTVQYAGTESGTTIEMEATSGLEVDGRPYESRVSVSAPDAGSFAIRQLLRAPGAEAWRLVVEMTYRAAGG